MIRKFLDWCIKTPKMDTSRSLYSKYVKRFHVAISQEVQCSYLKIDNNGNLIGNFIYEGLNYSLKTEEVRKSGDYDNNYSVVVINLPEGCRNDSLRIWGKMDYNNGYREVQKTEPEEFAQKVLDGIKRASQVIKNDIAIEERRIRKEKRRLKLQKKLPPSS